MPALRSHVCVIRAEVDTSMINVTHSICTFEMIGLMAEYEVRLGHEVGSRIVGPRSIGLARPFVRHAILALNLVLRQCT